jgi:3-hydroxyacyl-CoA dehydrogenase
LSRKPRPGVVASGNGNLQQPDRDEERLMSATWNVAQVAVLGAGTMGSRIAAHLANCGIPSCLLDIVPTQLTPQEQKKNRALSSTPVRNRIAQQGLEAALESRPPAFFTEEAARLITVGNFEDHLGWVAAADWIIEAVAENMEIKRSLWHQVAEVRKPGTVASTNTSGLSVARIAEGLPEEFRRHWLGTHFCNPPRYLHLLEVIPGPDTLPDVVERITHFADVRLGKGIIVARDTPNFIANRIGVFSTCLALSLVEQEGLTVEEADLLFHAAISWPRSALFGTLDLVGLDIFANAARTVYDNAPRDERREQLEIPAFVQTMLERGLLGNKSGSGFYRRPAKGGVASPSVDLAPDNILDLQTLEYRPRKQVGFTSLDAVRNADGREEKLRAVLQANDRAGNFLWKFLSQTFLYAVRRIPEIADSLVDIDRAMRWGYGWELGPFELWDAIGMAESVRRMERESVAIPDSIERMLRAGHRRFYEVRDGSLRSFDFDRGSHSPVRFPPGVLLLQRGPQTPPVIRGNPGSSLRDLGDGVGCVEFHSRMNVLGTDAFDIMDGSLTAPSDPFDALVIGNQGAHFSAGADLQHLLFLIQGGKWDTIDRLVSRFQQINLAIQYSLKPVVVAAFGQTLGGGCEIALAAPRVQAAAETYMGLVETGVGLVPAGGGVKNMLARLSDSLPPGADLLAATRELFRTIGTARVSSCADQARRLGFLRQADGITMNPDRLLADAKEAALELMRLGYRPSHPMPGNRIRVLGEAGLAEFRIALHLARQGGFITEYDAVVGGKLAQAICGGKLTGPATVSEQYLLDLEREAFLSLCGDLRTQARIAHTLKTGKPLRN